MISGSAIAEAVGTAIRSIPAVTALLPDFTSEGVARSRIIVHNDTFPKELNSDVTIMVAPSPSIVIRWDGTRTAGGQSGSYLYHDVAIAIRPGTLAPDPHLIARTILNSNVPVTGLPFKFSPIHQFLDTPADYGVSRQTDVEGIDYLELRVTYPEKGDV